MATITICSDGAVPSPPKIPSWQFPVKHQPRQPLVTSDLQVAFPECHRNGIILYRARRVSYLAPGIWDSLKLLSAQLTCSFNCWVICHGVVGSQFVPHSPVEHLGCSLIIMSKNYSEHCEELTHWKWFWCWERLRAGGEGDDRGWDGWMASPTRWTWVWVNSGDGDGQGGLVCCDSWDRKESDRTERLNWTEQWTLVCGFLCEHNFSFLTGKY